MLIPEQMLDSAPLRDIRTSQWCELACVPQEESARKYAMQHLRGTLSLFVCPSLLSKPFIQSILHSDHESARLAGFGKHSLHSGMPCTPRNQETNVLVSSSRCRYLHSTPSYSTERSACQTCSICYFSDVATFFLYVKYYLSVLPPGSTCPLVIR